MVRPWLLVKWRLQHQTRWDQRESCSVIQNWSWAELYHHITPWLSGGQVTSRHDWGCCIFSNKILHKWLGEKLKKAPLKRKNFPQNPVKAAECWYSVFSSLIFSSQFKVINWRVSTTCQVVYRLEVAVQVSPVDLINWNYSQFVFSCVLGVTDTAILGPGECSTSTSYSQSNLQTQ